MRPRTRGPGSLLTPRRRLRKSCSSRSMTSNPAYRASRGCRDALPRSTVSACSPRVSNSHANRLLERGPLTVHNLGRTPSMAAYPVRVHAVLLMDKLSYRARWSGTWRTSSARRCQPPSRLQRAGWLRLPLLLAMRGTPQGRGTEFIYLLCHEDGEAAVIEIASQAAPARWQPCLIGRCAPLRCRRPRQCTQRRRTHPLLLPGRAVAEWPPW